MWHYSGAHPLQSYWICICSLVLIMSKKRRDLCAVPFNDCKFWSNVYFKNSAVNMAQLIAGEKHSISSSRAHNPLQKHLKHFIREKSNSFAIKLYLKFWLKSDPIIALRIKFLFLIPNCVVFSLSFVKYLFNSGNVRQKSIYWIEWWLRESDKNICKAIKQN